MSTYETYWADAADDPIPAEQLPQPVDLRALLAGEPPEEDWCVEPLLPRGKHTGIVASRGDGKSLTALQIAAAKATGDPILDQPEGEPIHVVYLDQEMGPDDLYERLADLGYTTDQPKFEILEEHLHYYQLIDLEPLNTPEGGQTLEAIVAHHDAELLVIDTLSRVVVGKENSNELYQELWLHTEMRLKRRGITYVRLDHLGKDRTRGSRGGSAKEDPLDVVWELKVGTTGKLFFNKTKGRQSWLPETVAVDRVMENGILTHRTETQFAPEWLLDLVAEIDELGLAPDAGTPTVQKALQEHGRGRRRGDIRKAVRFRKGRETRWSQNPGPPPDHPNGTTYGTTPDHPPTKTGSEQGLHDRDHLRDHTGPGKGSGSHTLGGTTPTPHQSTFDDETERIAP